MACHNETEGLRVEAQTARETVGAVDLFSLLTSFYCSTSPLERLCLKSALYGRALCAQACLSHPGRKDFTDEL